jgi:phosphoglycolate phosphatase
VTHSVIFDLDGTLVDSRGDLTRACNHARAVLDLPPLPLATVASFVGDGAQKLIERLTPGADPPQRTAVLRAFQDHYAAHSCEDTRPYPGVAAMLDDLRAHGWRLGLATNKPLRFTRLVLDACGLTQRLDAVRGGDGARKPDPDQLLELLREFAAPPRDSWMAGDHHTDIRAARAAGCRALYCQWGFGDRGGLAVDALATSPAEVLSLVMA